MANSRQKYERTVGAVMKYPVYMDPEEIRRYREQTAAKLAETIKREIMEKIGPNWFLCDDGWRTGHDYVHQPGTYMVHVDFRIDNILERGW